LEEVERVDLVVEGSLLPPHTSRGEGLIFRQEGEDSGHEVDSTLESSTFGISRYHVSRLDGAFVHNFASLRYHENKIFRLFLFHISILCECALSKYITEVL
jgi:hypothetical protein